MKYKMGDRVWVDLYNKATDDKDRMLYLGPAVISGIEDNELEYDYWVTLPFEVDDNIEELINEREILYGLD